MNADKWRRGAGVVLPSDHVSSETVLQRRIDTGRKSGAPVGAHWQIIQRISAPGSTAWSRPSYRLVELRVLSVSETLRDARAIADEVTP